jgi:hypothetical protein
MMIVKVEVWTVDSFDRTYKISEEMRLTNITEGEPISDFSVAQGDTLTKVRGHHRERGIWDLIRRGILAIQDKKTETE